MSQVYQRPCAVLPQEAHSFSTPLPTHTLFVLGEDGAVHLEVTLLTGAQLVAEMLLHNLLLRSEKVLQMEEESRRNKTNKREKSACWEDFCQP